MTTTDVPDAETSRKLVEAALADMYTAWMDRDWERFNTHLDPEVTAWESHLPEMIRGLDELARYRAERGEPPAMRSLAADVSEVAVWGETAVARYLLVGEPVEPSTPRRVARVTEVFRWNGSDWVIVRRHAEAR
ncbi:nuclear transport factor 2 family protein [Kineococcus sp. SYSU DK003]|uniref:nuclear transport factor 2 family protein n=1 Tax=Kineococcus sp. SYSU DK003 TaxID=3383124 RepID=UPI003D7D1B60